MVYQFSVLNLESNRYCPLGVVILIGWYARQTGKQQLMKVRSFRVTVVATFHMNSHAEQPQLGVYIEFYV